ncbi:MAG TPA: immunity protein Tsi6 family protein [Alphaproteobacteria bacterium]|nr:immunity protein Tsi6 family protein [Alphaproteobacteria bacterium]
MSDNHIILSFLKYVEQETIQRKAILEKLLYFDTITKQIDFMSSVFDGRTYEHGKLYEINVGLIGLREFESYDSFYANLLSVIQYIANKKADGLKVDINIIKKYIPDNSI